MNSSFSVRSKFTNSTKSARFSGRSAAAARRRTKSSHFLLLWLPGSPWTLWTKLRGRGSRSTRERTSFNRSCSTDRERSRFVLESRQLAFLHVLLCISDVSRAFSPRFSRLDAQWIDLCIDVFIVAIRRVVAEILPFVSENIAKVGVHQYCRH